MGVDYIYSFHPSVMVIRRDEYDILSDLQSIKSVLSRGKAASEPLLQSPGKSFAAI